MAYLINADRTDARPVSFLCEEENGLQQGLFLEIVGMAKNNHWALGMNDFEAYKVQLATASTERGVLLIHHSVPNQYDERLSEVDFVLGKGKVGRAYQVEKGDEFTLAKEIFHADVAVGDKVILGANGKLAKSAGTEGEVVLGVVMKKRMLYNQESYTVRFN